MLYIEWHHSKAPYFAGDLLVLGRFRYRFDVTGTLGVRVTVSALPYHSCHSIVGAP